MKLPEHVDILRKLIASSFDKQFFRLGIGTSKRVDLAKIPQDLHARRQRFEEMLENHLGETGSYENAREKLVDELTFTLFNRIAAVKVMEAANLFPPIITKQTEHGDRSFGHKAWLEIRPDMRSEELEGIQEYITYAFNEMGDSLPLYSKNYPYALLPDAISLNEVIDAFNMMEKDPQIGADIWHSDDILGWLYESYNNTKKEIFKESKEKTEFDKVSLQSQVYTPRWVVKFLVDNSLGKIYLEMYPDSDIKNRYKIANAPKTQERKLKPLHEIKLIDPACGSGNFLFYAFDFFYALYLDQIENYGADYAERDIPKWIIENNLHGIDLDDRAVQIAQLGLYIKARKKQRSSSLIKFNVVSSDFFLPDYEVVRHIFEEGTKLDQSQKALIADIWTDLQFAYKFGSLIRLDEKLKSRFSELVSKREQVQPQLFSDQELGIKPKPVQRDLFLEQDIEQEREISASFFRNLKIAVEQYAKIERNAFLVDKTRDAITFLELLTTEYDVATANPPYTDSADFGSELKEFIEDNYKKPYKFHTNLYATFIKRCYEFINEDGKIAIIHPPTFMYIKTFEDVRKFIIDKIHINLFVEWGYLGLFNPTARVDSALYILEKSKKENATSTFIKLNHLYETKRYDALFEAYTRHLASEEHELLYNIPQSKLKIINSWPFIYWISDEFRKKFKDQTIKDVSDVALGLKTADNNKYLRFFWEVDTSTISSSFNDKKKWVIYLKGGAFNRWIGNEWLVVEWEDDGHKIKNQKNSQQIEKGLGFKAGVTLSTRSVKGVCGRVFERNRIFDMAASAIIYRDENEKLFWLGYSNSKLFNYVLNCLNPTVNKQPEDIRRLPGRTSNTFDSFSRNCIDIKNHLLKYELLNKNYQKSPLQLFSKATDLKINLKHYFNYENYLLTQVLLNEAIINEKVFDIFELTNHDKAMVLAQEGECIGGLPLSSEAREAFLAENEATKEFRLDNIRNFIQDLPIKNFMVDERVSIEKEFPTLYQNFNDLEEFCIRYQVNPINVWYWFKQSNVIPKQRMNIMAMEFLTDLTREILMEDEDGIIPLVPNAGEKVLLDRIEEKFREKGFSMAQYSSFDSMLGRPLNEYLNKFFFADLSDHLNLFMYLPKTPFIWHLSSGPEQGFDCYVIIYKWSRDKLMRLRSVYIENRERALKNRQSDLADNNSAESQNEKEKILKQLKEIEIFKGKIDELLSEGYDPILDDGVGKNIAPLQKKGMIPYEVLNAGQLKNYLNADW